MSNAKIIRLYAMVRFSKKKFSAFDGIFPVSRIRFYLSAMGINSTSGLYDFLILCKTDNFLYKKTDQIYCLSQGAEKKLTEWLSDSEKEQSAEYERWLEEKVK